MIAEIFIAVLLGCIAGTFTGLTPGVHINLVSLLILTFSVFLLKFTSPLLIAIFIISMSITHTFTDFIPSCFLGAPESDNVLSALPGHRLLLEGKGYEAVFLTVVGSLLGLILTIISIPLMIPFLKFLFPIVKPYIGYLLIIIVVLLIIRERKIWALIIFLLSGVFGVAVFSLHMSDPLFPMLSGLFGISMLILSYKQNTKIPPQIKSEIKIEKSELRKATFSSVVVGSIASFFPGLGPSQAAIIAIELVRKLETKGFLILVGSLNTVNMVVSLVTLYVIDKARNGSIVIMSQILEVLTKDYLILFLGVALVAGSIATVITLKTTDLFAKIMPKVNYRLLCLCIMAFVTLLAFILSGFLGLFVLLIGTSIGMIPQLKNIGKSHLMGCLLLPTILYFIL